MLKHSKIVELVFFYVSILAVAYVLWLLFSPYFVALALAGMLVLTAYPVHVWISTKLVRKSATVSALISTLTTYLFIVAPILFVVFLLTRETALLYEQLQANESFSFDSVFIFFQTALGQYFPESSISFSDGIKSFSAWGATQLQTVFSNIISFLISLFISIVATFFFFRDGKRLVAWLTDISPLPDYQNNLIVDRIHLAVRSVTTGIILVSLLQGLVAGFGFWIFGVPKPVLWGTVAAFGGLLPGIGTPVIMIPAVIYLFFFGSSISAVGLLIWAIVAIVVVDNIISPTLMGRGNALHPLVVLLSVFGGISLFGMIGVIVGPVIVSIFLVLLELQKKIVFEEKVTDTTSPK